MTVIDNDHYNNNDENDIAGCKGNPKTKDMENRYAVISNTFSVFLANFFTA